MKILIIAQIEILTRVFYGESSKIRGFSKWKFLVAIRIQIDVFDS